MSKLLQSIAATGEPTAPVTVIVGRNGSGKSRLLDSIAKEWSRQGRAVAIVANTVFDKFKARGAGVWRLSARRGRTLPSFALKMALTRAAEDGPHRLTAIADVLDHCGYRPTVGIRLRRSKPEQLELALYEADAPVSDEFRAWVEHYFDVLRGFESRTDETGTYWLPLDGKTYDLSRSADIVKLIDWEPRLRRTGALGDVELHLKNEWGPVRLVEGSSGELSLISTVAFLASVAVGRMVVIIDEPENSLHPEWQQRYLDLVLASLERYYPSLYVATHSPIVVGGVDLLSVPTEVVSLDGGVEHRRPTRGSTRSVEATYWEVLGTVTPVNHYLSERLVALLADLERGDRSLSGVLDAVERFRARSFDPKQLRLLDAYVRLARSVDEELRAGGVP